MKTKTLLVFAGLCWLALGLATLIGLRSYVSVLSFTPPSGSTIGSREVAGMVVYVALYAAATTLAPIAVIGAAFQSALQHFLNK